MQGYCDVSKWTILKRTSPEVKCLHPTSSKCWMCTLSVSNVIYHKFSHSPAFCTLKGKNVNVMLESAIIHRKGNIISILTLNRMKIQGYCFVYKWTLLGRASPEVKCLHPTSSRRKMCKTSISDLNYHRFSHCTASYTLSGKKVNVMLD